MDPIEVITETDADGAFEFPHGHKGRPASIVPDMRDEHVAMEVTAFDDAHVRGVLRSRDTGDPVPDAAFTARILVVA
jgi:hypothetical protein